MRPFEEVEVLRAACCIAGADGVTTEEENRVLNRIADISGVGDASLNAMLERAASDANFCDEQFRILKTDPQESMAILLDVAMADGVIDEREKKSLQQFAIRLGIPDNIFSELVSRTISLVDENATKPKPATD